MPSLHNQGMRHPRISTNNQNDCFLCHKGSPQTNLTTIVISYKKPFDIIIREDICKVCFSKLPTLQTRLATDREQHLYMERWMDLQFGTIL